MNQYHDLKVKEQLDLSSIARLKRFNEMKNPIDLAAAGKLGFIIFSIRPMIYLSNAGKHAVKRAMINVLGDNQNKKYPIFRNGSPPDDGLCIYYRS